MHPKKSTLIHLHQVGSRRWYGKSTALTLSLQKLNI